MSINKDTENCVTAFRRIADKNTSYAQSYIPNRNLLNFYALPPMLAFVAAASTAEWKAAMIYWVGVVAFSGSALIIDYTTGKRKHDYMNKAQVAEMTSDALEQGYLMPLPTNYNKFVNTEAKKLSPYIASQDPEHKTARLVAMMYVTLASMVFIASQLPKNDVAKTKTETSAILNERRENKKLIRTRVLAA